VLFLGDFLARAFGGSCSSPSPIRNFRSRGLHGPRILVGRFCTSRGNKNGRRGSIIFRVLMAGGFPSIHWRDARTIVIYRRRPANRASFRGARTTGELDLLRRGLLFGMRLPGGAAGRCAGGLRRGKKTADRRGGEGAAEHVTPSNPQALFRFLRSSRRLAAMGCSGAPRKARAGDAGGSQIAPISTGELSAYCGALFSSPHRRRARRVCERPVL